ncbi:MAG: efflux RND transporter periplasmic adaptor subunit [Pseudomonadota bacterium]
MANMVSTALKWVLKRTLWLAVLACVVFGGLMLGQSILSVRIASAAEGPTPLPVATATIALQDSYRASRRFPGRINAAQVSDVGFQVGGEVAEVLVEVGDRVEKGAPLARLNPERLSLRIGELQAARAEADASLRRAETTLQRTQDLYADGFATQQDLDDAVAERDGLRARVRQLTRSLENASVDLGDATLSAPYSGVIVGRYLDAGVTVTAGAPVLRLNEQGSLDALIGVPARFARRISIGEEFTVTANDLSSQAHVRGIGDEVDLATQTVPIRLEIKEDPGFVPGGLVRLELTEERRARGAWAPALALNESYRGLWSVYVVEDVIDNIGRIARKDVEIIHIGNERVFIRGTIESGDRVVAAAPFRFVPGQEVKIVEEVDMLALADRDAAIRAASLRGLARTAQ